MPDSHPGSPASPGGGWRPTWGGFRDAKLWPGGACGWDWNQTGTRHRPGVQPADVDELLAHRAAVVVIGQGQQGRLQVMDATVRRVKEAGAELEVLESPEAVQRYNQLVEEGAPVGALIHSTC